MKQHLFMLLISLVAFPTLVLAGPCDISEPKITVTVKPRQPTYITNLSRNQFLARENVNNPNTIGLTAAHLSAMQKFSYVHGREGSSYCANVSEINFEIGYDKLLVYIDNKYRPGSCPYNVTKDHEDYHVDIAMQAMEFYEQTIRDTVNRMKYASFRVVGYSDVDAVKKVQEKVHDQYNMVVRPVLEKINKKIMEKNAMIDTPESYMATHKLCPEKDW